MTRQVVNIFLANNHYSASLLEDAISDGKVVDSHLNSFISIGSLQHYFSEGGFHPVFFWKFLFKKKNKLFHLLDIVSSIFLFFFIYFRYAGKVKLNLYSPNFNHVLPNLLVSRGILAKVFLVAEGTLNYRSRKELVYPQNQKKKLCCMLLTRYESLTDPLELPDSLISTISIDGLFCRKTTGLVTSVSAENLITVNRDAETFSIKLPDTALLVGQHFLYGMDESDICLMSSRLVDFLNNNNVTRVFIKPHPTSGVNRRPIEADWLEREGIASEILTVFEPAERTTFSIGAQFLITMGYSTVLENAIDSGWGSSGLTVRAVGLRELAERKYDWALEFFERAKNYYPVVLDGFVV